MPPTIIKKPAQIPKRIRLLLTSLSTIFFWLLLIFRKGFFSRSVSTLAKRIWLYCLRCLFHFLNLSQSFFKSGKKCSLFLICSHNLMTRPQNVIIRIRNFKASFISRMLASVPIMPRPSTCSNGGIWFIELNAFRLSKIRHFKANKKALFLAL